MATILRVKRRLDDQPQDVLVLCKRSKLNNDGNGDKETACPSVPAIAKFAGTLKDPEEDIVHHLATRLYSKELNAATQRSCKDVLAKVHNEVKENSVANRYKVLEGLRKLDTSNVTEFKDKVLTFIDVEDSNSLTLNQDAASTECIDCAYDVYYVETEKDAYVDNDISVYAMYEHNMIWDTYREEESKDPFESEDSNSESNWRNDYPDSDIYRSQSSDESSARCQSDSLSSDEEDEQFIHSVDENDVELHGYKYARYKRRMQKLFNDNEECETSDNEEYETSNNDNDDSDDCSHKVYTFR